MIREERTHEGKLARLVLDAGKGNVLDRKLLVALDERFRALGEDHRVRVVLLSHAGDHFCFGASVAEHAPGEVESMLPAFHGLFRTIARAAVPIVVAVRGRCLGGGLELALAAHRIVVAGDAILGVPEITLGVFPPVAAAVLPLRAGQATADRLITSGETVRGADAVRLGLADESVPSAEVDGRALAIAEGYTHLSGAALRFAVRAARFAWDEALGARLDALEKLYLRELMATADAKEGIASFLEKRGPRWVDA
ncbi:MAG: enoyl-CoA hydratase/isomerase family protein [Sandaracinaceae bacterium]|nr:enoyl-CoA hydratase/isomerase family protein [Sandaracinaceae bacterium]